MTVRAGCQIPLNTLPQEILDHDCKALQRPEEADPPTLATSLGYNRTGEGFTVPHGVLVLVSTPTFSGWEGQQIWARKFAQALVRSTFPNDIGPQLCEVGGNFDLVICPRASVALLKA